MVNERCDSKAWSNPSSIFDCSVDHLISRRTLAVHPYATIHVFDYIYSPYQEQSRDRPDDTAATRQPMTGCQIRPDRER